MVLTRKHLYRFCMGIACLFGLSPIAYAQQADTSETTAARIGDQPASRVVQTSGSGETTDWSNGDYVIVDSATPFVTLEDDAFSDTEGMEFVQFPHEETPLVNEFIEGIPHLIEQPIKPAAKLFGRIIHGEHVEPHSELDEHPIGIQPIPERPPLLLEFNEEYLSPGWLSQGVEMPTGAVWRPSFWVWGNFRSAIQTYEGQRAGDPTFEWANRLDIFGQVNLTGTERIVLGMRPLDEERATSRLTSGYDIRNGNWLDGWNADFQTAFFEGDFGELFPRLDPYDTMGLDYGFSIGRMPLLAQQGLLIAEDKIDAVTVTRNTLYGGQFLNTRVTGVYSWNNVHRNSGLTGVPNRFDNRSDMYALLTETDFFKRTVNLDVVYVTSNEPTFGDMLAFGASAIRRHHGYENTYNTSAHFLASYPTNGDTAYAQQGELLFLQTSWTPHHTNDLVFVNGFWAIDEFTSPARGPFNGSALGLTGVLFAAPGIGRQGPPLAVSTDDVAGASIGYQMFFDETRQQVIWEVGGFKRTKRPDRRAALATAVRWQRAIGQHFIFVMDGAVSKLEGTDTTYGARAEFQVFF